MVEIRTSTHLTTAKLLATFALSVKNTRTHWPNTCESCAQLHLFFCCRCRCCCICRSRKQSAEIADVNAAVCEWKWCACVRSACVTFFAAFSLIWGQTYLFKAIRDKLESRLIAFPFHCYCFFSLSVLPSSCAHFALWYESIAFDLRLFLSKLHNLLIVTWETALNWFASN